MEKLNYDYSLKNIPIPDDTTYRLHLIEKIESVIKRMRWKAHFFLNETKDSVNRNTFGFKSRNHPKQCKEIENFEKDVLETVKTIKFKRSRDEFQTKMRNDCSEIKKSDNVYIFADKTNNIYEMSQHQHEKLLMENITKTYKKAPENLEKAINLEAKSIADSYSLSERIDSIAKSPAYITLKDHKENFKNSPSCRLINPSKNELGKISKSVLQRINKDLVRKLNVNQWKNTDEVIEWFKRISNKKQHTFIQLDIKEFYPSISHKSLVDALTFAKKYTNITPEEERNIFHCRRSLLYKDEEAWKKKDTESCFDVTMGSFDGAETCELIGTHILSTIESKLKCVNMGLYRDDGLIALKSMNGPAIDKIRKQLIEIFKSFGFKIEINANLKQVDFLDVTFKLENESYEPYKKPNDQLLYINTSSNHPPTIIKQLPNSIADRLSKNSSTEAIFNKHKIEYEAALHKSGYKTKLEYKTQFERKNRNRQRKIIWFNPPFSKNVTTNVAGTFLKLIDKHFPPTNKLNKIFNRNTVKVSYSCTGNMSQKIKNHNINITSKRSNVSKDCNCRDKGNCPVDGKCRIENVIYKCIVTCDEKPRKVYIGLAMGEWKIRHRNHKKSFNHKKYANETSLSSYVWELKNNGITPSLTWSIEKSIQPYSNITKRCSLCLHEKLAIITYNNESELLNKRTELISKCRHENSYLLKNYKNK